MKNTKSKRNKEEIESNKELLSKVHSSFNDKAKYIIRKLNEKYEEDPNFFLQRHEFSRLMTLLTKDSVLVTESPFFYYNDVRYEVEGMNSERHYINLVNLNYIYILHDIDRGEKGDIVFYGKIMI